MNNKNNMWAMVVKNREMNEAIQRIAYSFKYKWRGSVDSSINKECDIRFLNASVLYFSIEEKLITYSMDSNETYLNNNVFKVCYTIDGAVATFNNPPKIIKSEKIGNAEVFPDGSILFNDWIVLTSDDVDNIIRVRNKLIKNEQ